MSKTVKIASIYPTLLGTYGDGGNVAALRHIAALHGISVSVDEVSPGQKVPANADIYVLGGGEDTAQSAAAAALHASGALAEGVKNGAAVLSICVGYQILGHTFLDAEGKPSQGLGLLDSTMLVAGSMIGSGIFIVSADIARRPSEAFTAVVSTFTSTSFQSSVRKTEAGRPSLFTRFAPSGFAAQA